VLIGRKENSVLNVAQGLIVGSQKKKKVLKIKRGERGDV